MVKQRILVVDDDKEVVRLMRAYLEQAGYEVLMAYDGETAVHMLRREQPDLLLLDLMLPDRDGLDITRLIRSDQTLAHIPIIMLTARVDDTDKIIGLEMGADDYVTKPYNPREVVARVRSRLRARQRSQHSQLAVPLVLQVGDLTMDVNRHTVHLGERPINLTATEFNLLRVLIENAGYVFTRSELISKGLGADYEGLERTLDSHMRNLRRKIEPDPEKLTYIHTVYGVGYRFAEEKE